MNIKILSTILCHIIKLAHRVSSYLQYEYVFNKLAYSQEKKQTKNGSQTSSRVDSAN